MTKSIHPREMLFCVRDPGVSVGRFKVYQRVDGLFIVYDPLRPPARRTVDGETFVDMGDAHAFALEVFKREEAPAA